LGFGGWGACAESQGAAEIITLITIAMGASQEAALRTVRRGFDESIAAAIICTRRECE
jgi:hypothetical protein